MGLFSASIKTLDDLFLHLLGSALYAGNRIAAALPELREAASGDGALRELFDTHLRETNLQITRIEQVFGLLGADPAEIASAALDGAVAEARSLAGEIEAGWLRDTALVASAQAIGHHAITRYGTLVAFAERLGRRDCATVLTQSLDEEKATDVRLTLLATELARPQDGAD